MAFSITWTTAPRSINPIQVNSDGDARGDLCDLDVVEHPGPVAIGRQSVRMKVEGGIPPYRFALQEGPGELVRNRSRRGYNRYTSPESFDADPDTSAVVRATDAVGNTVAINIKINSPDKDFDGILNQDDNCPMDHNPGQQDRDGNGVGDRCAHVRDFKQLVVLTYFGTGEVPDHADQYNEVLDLASDYFSENSNGQFRLSGVIDPSSSVDVIGWLDLREENQNGPANRLVSRHEDIDQVVGSLVDISRYDGIMYVGYGTNLVRSGDRRLEAVE